jgi:hypothetical protein
VSSSTKLIINSLILTNSNLYQTGVLGLDSVPNFAISNIKINNVDIKSKDGIKISTSMNGVISNIEVNTV